MRNKNIVKKYNTGSNNLKVIAMIMLLTMSFISFFSGFNYLKNDDEMLLADTKTTTRAVTGVTLNKTTLNLAINGSEKLKATVLPAGATYSKIKWTSSNKKVAKVTKYGTVRGVKAGTATITVKVGSKTAKCTVTVSKIALTSITLDSTQLNVYVGGDEVIEAKVTPVNATEQDITWTSSNTSVATVDIYGTVRGIKAGTTTITATSNGKKATRSVKVIANPYKTDNQICESVKGNASIDYASFKELAKYHKAYGNEDDYYVLKATHDCANKYNKPIVVKAVRPRPVYNIYQIGRPAIVVKTSVEFGSSTFYIHDEKGIIQNYKMTKAADRHIFDIRAIDESVTYTETLTTELKQNGVFLQSANAKKAIEKIKAKLPGATITGYYVHVSDKNKKRNIFIRSGNNRGEKDLVHEAFTVDTNDWKINEPIQWTYKGSKVKVTLRPVLSNKLTITNGHFVTIISSEKAQYKGYVKRAMKISRSNIEVSYLDHSFVNSKKQRVDVTNYAYQGFYYFEGLTNVNFHDSTLRGLRRIVDGDVEDRHSTYDLKIKRALHMTLNKIKMPEADLDKVIDSGDNANQLSGVVGSSYTKDITYKNCILNRIDTHRGVYNLTVEDTTLGTYGLTQTGFGTLTLKNVKIKHANQFIQLRGDYGSLWHGSVVIQGNNHLYPDDLSKTISLISASPKANWNYGYDLYLPNINLTSGSTITIHSSKAIGKNFPMYGNTATYYSTYTNPQPVHYNEIKFTLKSTVINKISSSNQITMSATKYKS